MNIVDRIGKKQMEKVLAQRSIPEFGAGYIKSCIFNSSNSFIY